jgi:hypothetical protein
MLEDASSITMDIQVLNKLQTQKLHGSLTLKVAQVLVDTALVSQDTLHVYAVSDQRVFNEILDL